MEPFLLFSSRCFSLAHSHLSNLKGFKSESSPEEVRFRKIKSIHLPKFKNDLRTSELLLNTPNHLVDLVNCFNTTLKSITDKHAPWRKRSMTQRAHAPRLSDEIRSAKRRRRITERNWRSTKSESDWRTFTLLRNKVVFLMNKSLHEFYTDFVSNISGDQRKLLLLQRNCSIRQQIRLFHFTAIS